MSSPRPTSPESRADKVRARAHARGRGEALDAVLVQVECWCGGTTVGATLAEIRDGWTRPCEEPRCKLIAVRERDKRAGHGEVSPNRP